MANFPPLKDRFLLALDRAFSLFPVQGRFLDYGCGRGDVAQHLVKSHQMQGDLLDLSAATRENLRQQAIFDSSAVFEDLQEVAASSYQLVTAFDVIEHVSQPRQVLQQLHQCLELGGKLALTLPYRPETWGWDDHFYGHLRRWSLRGVIDALESIGFEILHLKDPTFPVYSSLRQAMLRFKKPNLSSSEPSQASLDSPWQNSWGAVPKWTHLLPWRFINRLSCLFEHIYRGDEIFVLAVKSGRQMHCEVCDRGIYTHMLTIGRHLLQKCRHCGSQRVAPAFLSEDDHHHRPVLWTEDWKHIRDILRWAPQARSLLHIGCGRGYLLKEMKTLGWDVLGVESHQFANAIDAIPISYGKFMDVEIKKKWDLIALHGELEFMENLLAVFDRLKMLLTNDGVLMLEMVDSSRPSQKILQVLERSMNLLNVRVVCDQLANRNMALYARRRVAHGRLQLWFRNRDS